MNKGAQIGVLEEELSDAHWGPPPSLPISPPYPHSSPQLSNSERGSQRREPNRNQPVSAPHSGGWGNTGKERGSAQSEGRPPAPTFLPGSPHPAPASQMPCPLPRGTLLMSRF